MIGGENGSVFMCNKKAKSANDKITHIYPGHHGPVYALQVFEFNLAKSVFPEKLFDSWRLESPNMVRGHSISNHVNQIHYQLLDRRLLESYQTICLLHC
jgi:hypothetical protein